MVLVSKTRELKPVWDTTIVTAFEEVFHLEEQLKNLPAAPTTEIECMMTRFIEYARKEKEKGNKILDDSLM